MKKGSHHSKETLEKLKGNKNCLGKKNFLGHYHTEEADPGDVDINVSIMEWDGTELVSEGAESTDSPIQGANDEVFTAPSETDITMRRLRVTFTYNVGTTTILYDNATNDSNLQTGTVIPERNLPFFLIALFMPRLITAWNDRKKKRRLALAWARTERFENEPPGMVNRVGGSWSRGP